MGCRCAITLLLFVVISVALILVSDPFCLSLPKMRPPIRGSNRSNMCFRSHRPLYKLIFVGRSGRVKDAIRTKVIICPDQY